MPSERLPLHRDPVAVAVAGTQLWLPYRPAAVWSSGCAPRRTLVTELATPEQREVLADLITENDQAFEDVTRESHRILSEATGRHWWEAERLINTAAGHRGMGLLTVAGVDPWSVSVGQWCAATYTLYAKGRDEKSLLKLDFELALPPPGYEDAWDDEGDDPDATLAAVNAINGW